MAIKKMLAALIMVNSVACLRTKGNTTECSDLFIHIRAAKKRTVGTCALSAQMFSTSKQSSNALLHINQGWGNRNGL